ncbi:MAG: hypothetical protein JXB39_12385 [Deltaproteobacteria bacterium]|nr:hypothetical protein [Deltaproteobacteria bacterium]
MSATFGGSPTKATFQILEGPHAGIFQVQYNPKEFRVQRSVQWSEHEENGQPQGFLEFQQGSAMSVTMDLIFDTTCESGAARDVRAMWVNGLLVMTNAECQPESGESQDQDKQRPPKILFTWGSFQLTCVVESVDTTYLLFSGDGTPLRARCSVQLKEWTESTYAAATGGKRWEGNAIRLVEAKAGSLPANVAWETRTPWRKIAEDNDLDDPMAEIPAGMEIVVRRP